MQQAERNPFQPGAGSYPPVLAGREEEQARLTGLVRTLADWRPGLPLQPIHLIQAPRGMGKTVLLQALVRRVEEVPALGRVAVLRTPASSLADMDDIARHVSLEPHWYRDAWQWFAGLRWIGLHMQRPARQMGRAAVDAAFDRRLRTPFLLLVDEAHALPPDVCHVLLNAFQDRSGRQPCALVLAGTPALKPFLLSGDVNASFVERAPVIAPGLLPPEEAQRALQVPAWESWKIDRMALEAAAGESSGYPYFLQLWGWALWDAGQARRVLDGRALAVARERVAALRAELYVNRFDEFEHFAIREGIDRHAILSAVQAVAREAAQPDAALATSALDSLLEQAGLDARTGAQVRRCMADTGFLVRAGDMWHPGIPSLAAYIADHPRSMPAA